MMKRLFSLILCLCLLAAVITGCTGTTTTTKGATTASGPVTIRVRSGWNEAGLPQFPAAISKYQTDHPGVTINMEYTPTGEDSMAKLRAEFVAKNPPDVVQAWKTYFNEFVDQGLVENLTADYAANGWVAGTLNNGARNWAAKLSDAAKTNPDVYGVADYVNTSVFFYNTKIFKDLGLTEPTTTDELIAVAKKLSAAGIKPLIGAGAVNNFTDLIAKVQVQFTGLQYLIDVNAGKAKLTDEPMLKAMQVVERLMKEGVVDKNCLTYKEVDCVAEMAKGTAGMFFMHTVFDKQLRDAQTATPAFEFAIMKGIKFTDNPKCLTSCTYGGVWMVPTFSKVKPQAKDFLFYMFGEEVAKTSASLGGRITNMVKANASLTSKTIKVVVDSQMPALNNESFYLIDMVPGGVLKSLLFGMQEMLQGKADSLTVLKNAQVEMDKILADKK